MKRNVFILFAILALGAAAFLSGTEYGKGGPVVVIAGERADGMDFSFRNETRGHLAMSFFFTTFENLRANSPLPFVASIGPGETVGGLSIFQKDKAKRWDCYFKYSWRYGDLDAVHDPEASYALPYEAGTKRKVIQGYGGSFSHSGEFYYSIDFGMPVGTKVLAARGGKVSAVEGGFDGHGTTKDYLQKNNFVVVEHEDGTIGYYVHFKKGGILVKPGDRVEAGTPLALSGNVGFSTTPHLHFAVQKPLSGEEIEGIPVRFAFGGELVELVEGRSY